MSLALGVAACHGTGDGATPGTAVPSRRGGTIDSAVRLAARQGQPPQAVGVTKRFAGIDPSTARLSPLTADAPGTATMALPPDMGVLAPPDYFAVPNFANSPLPTVDPGPITAVKLTNGGGGYVNPVVAIDDPTGSGAVITATATAGVITALSVTAGGTGYSNPTLSFSDANGIAAGASATVTAFGTLTGGMQKFVDTLPGLCSVSGANDLNQCIPIATPDTSTFPGSDFYRIGVTQYSQKMHRDLPPTTLRGYVQLDDNNNPLYDPVVGTQQYMGPLIIATRGRPTRVLLANKLPTGAAGNLFIPTDLTYMGAGQISDGVNTAMAAQNRALFHLHGGNTPWISDGTPHQWVTPPGEPVPAARGFAKGFSFANVPDMPAKLGFTPSLGDGLGTYLWTNDQSGRLMFWHDHAYGITRLNVYAGEASGYLLVDPVEEDGLQAASVPGTLGDLAGGATPADLQHVIPLIIQDKSFVPDDGAAGGQLAATDPTWDVARYGGKGSLWFPHVDTPNQNPYDMTGANPYGRWDYGPWFWPPQIGQAAPLYGPISCTSAAYPGQTLTCPAYPNPAGTMEAFMDTPVVNGTAYPTMAITPSAYRFQVLSVGNDRSLHLGLYYAVDKNGVVCKGGNTFDAASCTEVAMLPAVAPPLAGLPACKQDTVVAGGLQQALATLDANGNPINGTGLPAGCWPSTWPTDGRDGGVPDPTTAGPPLVVIGTEGGLLPAPVVIPSTPMGYEYNRRSITVLNTFTHGLIIGPAERADVVVDFASVPTGSVLIVYNDSPAPMPGFDPRLDYYTGDPDQTPTGGAPTTQRGYGPNTRTIMQIQVNGAPANAFSLAALQAVQPALFATTQDKIIVPESAYPAANGGGPDNYVRIEDTAYTGWIGGGLGTFTVGAAGSGYTTPLNVAITGGGGSGATASAALVPTAVASLNLASGGSGYITPPAVAFSGGSGSGAAATAVLATVGAVASVNVTNGGNGYTSTPTVAFSGGGGSGATATATLTNRRVTAITVTNPGSGYTSAPTVTISGGGGSGARATAALGYPVASFVVTAGGSGYTDAPLVTLSGGGGSGAAATAQLTPAGIASVTIVDPGTGYTAAPTVTVSGGAGTGAVVTADTPVTPLKYKTIQELFTLDYGAMNATLGVELPLTNFNTQTTIPYGYNDPPTEMFKDGEVQLWKITHNGVDSHFIHVHLFTAQVINRVGWDGAIKPPDPTEMSWKDTIRMNPLEDIIIAVRPMQVIDKLGITTGGVPGPFQLPNSVRPLDVTMPAGAAMTNEFTTVDPNNNPVTVTNDVTNYGWEYVWHCHILGHEEMDMMRTMSLVAAPGTAPGAMSATKSGFGNNQMANLSWTDTTPNETEFAVQRGTSPTGPWTTITTIASTSGPATGATYTYSDQRLQRHVALYYRVLATNTVGYTKTFAAPATGWPTETAASAPSAVVSVTTN